MAQKGTVVLLKLFKFEVRGIEQDLIPYEQHLVLSNVPIEG